MIIKSRSVSKFYSDSQVLDEVSFDVGKGCCFGLLGPNGAGKSTLINIIYGATSRQGGDLTVFGMDPAKDSREIKKRLGIVTQEDALDVEMNVFDNMMIYAGFVGLERGLRKDRIHQLLEYMSLGHKKKSSIRALSGGMKRRLVFVRALLSDPELVILDEPTTGLDPAVRRLLWKKIRDLKDEGKTVLLTTHYMEEAEALCDQLLILDDGKVKTIGSPNELINSNCPGFVATLRRKDEAIFRSSGENLGNLTLSKDVYGIQLRGSSISEITDFLEGQKITPKTIRPSNLEDVFLNITGRELTTDA